MTIKQSLWYFLLVVALLGCENSERRTEKKSENSVAVTATQNESLLTPDQLERTTGIIKTKQDGIAKNWRIENRDGDFSLSEHKSDLQHGIYSVGLKDDKVIRVNTGDKDQGKNTTGGSEDNASYYYNLIKDLIAEIRRGKGGDAACLQLLFATGSSENLISPRNFEVTHKELKEWTQRAHRQAALNLEDELTRWAIGISSVNPVRGPGYLLRWSDLPLKKSDFNLTEAELAFLVREGHKTKRQNRIQSVKKDLTLYQNTKDLQALAQVFYSDVTAEELGISATEYKRLHEIVDRPRRILYAKKAVIKSRQDRFYVAELTRIMKKGVTAAEAGTTDDEVKKLEHDYDVLIAITYAKLCRAGQPIAVSRLKSVLAKNVTLVEAKVMPEELVKWQKAAKQKKTKQ